MSKPPSDPRSKPSKSERKAATKSSGGTPATQALSVAGVSYSLHPYVHDPKAPSYGLEAAAALGVSPDRVFKTLLADVDGQLIVAVVPVAGQLDLKALAASVGGKKAVMADPVRAQKATGYVVGGISPLGQKSAHPTVVDISITGYPTIFVSGGRRGLDVELPGEDLIELTNARVAPIGRPG